MKSINKNNNNNNNTNNNDNLINTYNNNNNDDDDDEAIILTLLILTMILIVIACWTFEGNMILSMQDFLYFAELCGNVAFHWTVFYTTGHNLHYFNHNRPS